MKTLNSRSIQLCCCAVAMISAVSVTSVVIAQTETPPPLVVMKGVKDVQTPEFKQYQYGMPLDISKVVKMEYFPPEEKFCGVIPAAMTYQDSKGEMHGLVYLYPETSGCTH